MNGDEATGQRRLRISSSMITAIAAGIVSLSALGVSIYEAYLMREQQAASVLPIIDFWSAYSAEQGYSLNIANKGLGPAFVRDIEVTVDDTPMRSWSEVIHGLTQRQLPHSESAMIGSVMAPGDIGTMLALTDFADGTAVWQQAHRVKMRICYCSVFKKCWTTTVPDGRIGTPVTEEARACQAVPGVTF